jgi:hypothetical protein
MGSEQCVARVKALVGGVGGVTPDCASGADERVGADPTIPLLGAAGRQAGRQRLEPAL